MDKPWAWSCYVESNHMLAFGVDRCVELQSTHEVCVVLSAGHKCDGCRMTTVMTTGKAGFQKQRRIAKPTCLSLKLELVASNKFLFPPRADLHVKSSAEFLAWADGLGTGFRGLRAACSLRVFLSNVRMSTRSLRWRACARLNIDPAKM